FQGAVSVNGDSLSVTITDNVVVESNLTVGISVDNTFDLNDIDGSDLTIGGSAVIRNNGSRGVFVGTGWNLTATDDVQILDNGGGIYVWPLTVALPRTVVMSGNLVVQGNVSEAGGGLLLETYGAGPGEYRFAATITDNVRIIGNAATTGNGGGILNHEANLRIDGNALIASNTATGTGGGVYHRAWDTPDQLVITGSSVIRDNIAWLGGGVGIAGCGGVINGSARITGNTSGELGGGLFLDDDQGFPASLVTEPGSLITWNTARGGAGGGVYSADSQTTHTIAPGTIRDNDPDNCDGYVSC
ncbi:MAG: hypothetical protein ACR2J8_16055, partial [Thermomicrobiales bacterium]